MKKLFMFALLLVGIAASAFAKDPTKVNYAAAANFAAEFKKASNVSWTSNENYVKASFVVNNERMEAYYTQNGDKIGTSRAINIEELPVKAKRAFAKKFGEYTVKEAIEFDGAEEISYYISAENETESVILKVDESNGLTTYKKMKK